MIKRWNSFSQFDKWVLFAGAVMILIFGAIIEKHTALKPIPPGPMTDLEVYLRAAWAVRSERGIYDITDTHGWHYLYPPLVAILFVPLAAPPRDLPGGWEHGYVPFEVSVALWYFISLGCVLLAVHLLARMIEEKSPLIRDQRSWWLLRACPMFICGGAVMTDLARGQMNSVMLLLFAAFLYSLRRRRQLQAGLWLGAAICIKIIPAALLIYPIWRQKWKVLVGSVIGGFIGLALIPAAVLGPKRTIVEYQEYYRVFLLPGANLGTDTSRDEELLRYNSGDSQSLLSVIHNATHFTFPRESRPSKPDALAQAAAFLIGLIMFGATLWAAGRRHDDSSVNSMLFFGLLVVNTLMISPKSHSHYFTLLIPLVMAIIADQWNERRTVSVSAPVFLILNYYLIVDSFAHLRVDDSAARDLGIVTLGSMLIWGAGLVALLRKRINITAS
jgi:hypothetical protein